MKLRYGWVMVAVGGLMGCVAVGAMMSLAVFLQPITAATGWSRRATAPGRLFELHPRRLYGALPCRLSPGAR